MDGRRVPHEQLQRAVAALCDAQDFAQRDDLENARAAFQDRAHDDLHTIAAALDAQDRATESRILRAKNRIETDFSAGDLAAIKADFPDLVDAAESGLRVLNVEPLPCG